MPTDDRPAAYDQESSGFRAGRHPQADAEVSGVAEVTKYAPQPAQSAAHTESRCDTSTDGARVNAEHRAAQRYRYHVSFSVTATKEEAEGLAVAVANAVDCKHVGPIFISPGEAVIWEAESDAE